MSTKFFNGVLLLLFAGLFMSAASLNKLPVTTGEITPLEASKNMREVLKAKSVNQPLSDKEAKLMKTLDKKINKWEKRDRRRAAKGKAPVGGKSWVAAFLLSFFFGVLGIHRFYLGYTWQGVVQLLTLGGFGIWALIDFIRIIVRDLQPKDGFYED